MACWLILNDQYNGRLIGAILRLKSETEKGFMSTKFTQDVVPLTAYGAKTRRSRMILLSNNITDDLFVQ